MARAESGPQTPEKALETSKTILRQAQEIIGLRANPYFFARVLGSFPHDNLPEGQNLESLDKSSSPTITEHATLYTAPGLNDYDEYFNIDSLNRFAINAHERLSRGIKPQQSPGIKFAHKIDNKGGIVFPKISFGQENLRKIITTTSTLATDDPTRNSDPETHEKTIVRGGTDIIILPVKSIYDLFLDWKAQAKIPKQEFVELKERITQKRIDAIRKGKPF